MRKNPMGGPDRIRPDEPREILVLAQSDPTQLGEPLEGARQNDARAGNEIAFSQHEVGGEIVCSPALDQCGNRRAELLEDITQLKALLRVERNISHTAGVYGCRRRQLGRWPAVT